MLIQRRARFFHLLGSAALIGGMFLGSMASSAMELGRPQTLSGLGEALSLKLPLRLSPGETLNADCIKVTIETANQVLPAHQVLKTVDYQADTRSAWVWVKTTVVIEEPVLKLALGCPLQQVTAFVDPAPAKAPGAKPVAAQPVTAAVLNSNGGTAGKAEAQASAMAKVSPPANAMTQKRVLTLGADQLRFDLGNGQSAKSFKGTAASNKLGAWQKDAQDPARSGFGLLMSLDPGRAPQALVASAASAASGPGLGQRVLQAENEFASLQKEQASLNQELDSLSKRLADRQSQPWAEASPLFLLAAAAVLALAGLAFFVLRPRWRMRAAPAA